MVMMMMMMMVVMMMMMMMMMIMITMISSTTHSLRNQVLRLRNPLGSHPHHYSGSLSF